MNNRLNTQELAELISTWEEQYPYQGPENLPQDVTVNSPGLKAIPIKEKTEMMHISLLSLKGKRHSPLAEKFLEVLKAETQKIEARRETEKTEPDVPNGVGTQNGVQHPVYPMNI